MGVDDLVEPAEMVQSALNLCAPLGDTADDPVASIGIATVYMGCAIAAAIDKLADSVQRIADAYTSQTRD